jgi:hypothetical protein
MEASRVCARGAFFIPGREADSQEPAWKFNFKTAHRLLGLSDALKTGRAAHRAARSNGSHINSRMVADANYKEQLRRILAARYSPRD